MITQYAFTGGHDAVDPWGQKSVIQFGGTWLAGEWWSIQFVSTIAPQNFTIGAGYLTKVTKADELLPHPTACYSYQNRVWLAMGKQFNFSAVDEDGSPRYTEWEEKDAGAGYVLFQSQYGNQDLCQAFGQIQGKLVVFGKLSVQIWTIGADPIAFAISQILDNAGTDAVNSPQNVGDYDTFFLDRTGVRNVRMYQDTLNSVVDDLGIAIDELLRTKLQTFNMRDACGIVEPINKMYWIYVGGAIYVLSRYIGAKITAWSTFDPRDQNGVVFAPEKFVVLDRRVYCRSVERYLLLYGGPDGTLYDGCVATVEIPWLDDNAPKMEKMAIGLDAAIQGYWVIRAGMDPESWDQDPLSLDVVYTSQVTGGTESKDSTFDRQHIAYNQQGTHFKIVAQSNPMWKKRARISEIVFQYNKTE